MKKSAIIAGLFVAILGMGNSAFAALERDYAEMPEKYRDQAPMGSDNETGPQGMGGGQGMGMMGGKGMGMKGGPSSMVALMDGSIIVLSGNKLTKYDSDLNVIKEVEIKGGPMAMEKMDRMKKPRMAEDNMRQPSSELSDSVPAMLEAAATPPPLSEPEGSVPAAEGGQS